MRSVSSSAACRPIAGSEPAPRPSVIFAPIWILFGTLRSFERLRVRVHDVELDAIEPFFIHAAHGVGSAAADADHFDARAAPGLFLQFVFEVSM